MDGADKVNLTYCSVTALAWLDETGDADWNSAGNINTPAGAFIDNEDLAVLVRHWLESGCL